MPKINLEGRRFGRLVVLRDSGRRASDGCVFWFCQCDCGNLKEIRSKNLVQNMTKSCGCLNADNQRRRLTIINHRHGDAERNKILRLYQTWLSLKSRCYRKSGSAYRYYGGKGIKVCPEWKNDYLIFKKWALANGYQRDLTIDRIDNDSNYCPKNCQWMTKSEHSTKTNLLRWEKYRHETQSKSYQ